jgi:glucan phosphoethanolaminetransferase (alkaline phosphatase superfamily)
MQTKKKRDRFNLFFGIIVVAAGIFFLLQNLFPTMAVWDFFWPILPILLGLTLIQMGSLFHDGGRSFFVLIGSMLMMAGLLLLIQNYIKHPYWWSYAWPLIFPGAFGIGQIICSRNGTRKNTFHNGLSFLIIGIVFFLFGLLLFQYVFRNSLFNEGMRSQLNYGFMMVCLGIFILLPKKYCFNQHVTHSFSRAKENLFSTQEKSKSQSSNTDYTATETQEESSKEYNEGGPEASEANNKTNNSEEVDDFLTH